jgi:Diphthamide synthase subunit DPH2
VSYFFDEEYISSEIRRRGAKKVLLQFPEGLRYFSTEVVERLRERLPDVEFIISGEPSWGACDLAEDEAQLLKVDLLVHFGHSPYTWYYPKFPTLFVRAESKLELSGETLDKLAHSLEGKERVGLTSTIQHWRLVNKVREFLSSRGVSGGRGEALLSLHGGGTGPGVRLQGSTSGSGSSCQYIRRAISRPGFRVSHGETGHKVGPLHLLSGGHNGRNLQGAQG